VKRKLICAVLFSAAPGLLHASGVIAVSCGGASVLTASTTCSNSATYGSILETFSNDLQWNAANDIVSPTLTATNASDPASANGGLYNTTWDAVGLPISVTGSDIGLADNYIQVKKFNNWVTPTTPGPQIYEGMFDSQPDASAGSPGDYLIGSGNGSAITIASTNPLDPLSSFGFRISTQDYTSFDVVIQLYGATGNAIGSPLVVSNLGGGGLCTNLAAATPVPCNTAPFIQVTTGGGVYSFSVYTTQTDGQADTGPFFLDTFYYSGAPEPGSLLLAGAGLASMIAFARRRNGRKALGHVGAETVDKA
jgi:hypothetical protein